MFHVSALAQANERPLSLRTDYSNYTDVRIEQNNPTNQH